MKSTKKNEDFEQCAAYHISPFGRTTGIDSKFSGWCGHGFPCVLHLFHRLNHLGFDVRILQSNLLSPFDKIGSGSFHSSNQDMSSLRFPLWLKLFQLKLISFSDLGILLQLLYLGLPPHGLYHLLLQRHLLDVLLPPGLLQTIPRK